MEEFERKGAARGKGKRKKTGARREASKASPQVGRSVQSEASAGATAEKEAKSVEQRGTISRRSGVERGRELCESAGPGRGVGFTHGLVACRGESGGFEGRMRRVCFEA